MLLRSCLMLVGLVLAGCATPSAQLWHGADLSYVNELEDCGAVYRVGAEQQDPYKIFAEAGANVVRLRLWHNPDWTNYSTLADVKKSIARAHAQGMKVLLDFHYSDDWAHPGKQLIPAAWKDAQSVPELAARVHDYTYATLMELHAEGLTPEFVQVGNEINTDILITKEIPEDAPVDWERNVPLVNAGIAAVREAAKKSGKDIKVMLHIAQPENVERWFDGMIAGGLAPFDLLGLSYYAKWSSVPFQDLSSSIARFKNKYGRPVIVVETAYPWTFDGKDEAGNILGPDSLIEGYPATLDGQRQYLIDLMQTVVDGGGSGVVYWEPAWISTACETRWGKGSHWENAAFFDYESNALHKGADFLGMTFRPSAQPNN